MLSGYVDGGAGGWVGKFVCVEGRGIRWVVEGVCPSYGVATMGRMLKSIGL